MTDLNDISKASQDADLRDRLYSAAAELGIQDPEAWVIANSRRLAASQVAADQPGATIASVYAYACTNRTLPAGKDPSAVTDAYIRYVVEQLYAAPPA